MLDDTANKKTKVRDFEEKYVHNVYNDLALSSKSIKSKSSKRCWQNKVTEFLESLPKISLIGDVGFGDGKYLNIHDGLTIGIEKCLPLCERMRLRHQNVTIAADVTNLPFRQNLFDGLICVAVIHHLATRNGRIAALRELSRILTPGGRLLITAWAIGAKYEELGGCDVLVPFKKKTLKNEASDLKENEDEEENFKNTALNYLQTEFNHLKKRIFTSSILTEIQSKLEQTRQTGIFQSSSNESSTKKFTKRNQHECKDAEQQHYKYYHIFTHTELTELIVSVGTFKILEVSNHKDTWIYMLAKL